MPIGPPLDVFQAVGGGGGTGGVSSVNGETGPLTITGTGGIAISTPSAAVINVDGSGISGAVTSLNTLVGALTIAAGTNITVTPSGGNTLTIAASAAAGVTTWNGATGAVTLTAGTNVTIGQVGSAFTISAATASGLSSLNGLTGAVSITSPDNFLSISNSGTNIRLTAGTGSFVTLATNQTYASGFPITGDKAFGGAVTFGHNGVGGFASSCNASNFRPLVTGDIGGNAIAASITSQLAGNITGATNATPIVIHYSPNTTNTTPIQTGDTVTIVNVLGNTAANGDWVVTVIDPTHFSLNGSTGNGAWTSGGNIYWGTVSDPTDSQATNAIVIQSVDGHIKPTSAIYVQTTNGALNGFRSGFVFGANSVDPAGYGIDFNLLGAASAVPIRIANNTVIKGRNAAGNGDVSLFGISASDAPTVASLAYPTADGSAGQVLQTDGAGNLSFGSVAATWAIRIATTGPDNMTNSDNTVLADTTLGSFTVNLPPTPIDGMVVNVKKIAAGNVLTIGHNGNNIDGAASDLTVNANMVNVTMQFETTFGWAIL